MPRVTIDGDVADRPASDTLCRQLEAGDVLYFPHTPFDIPEDDRRFLLSQKQSERFHKNVSYRPKQDRLKGVDANDTADFTRMHEIMRAYSQRAVEFCANFLPRYADQWRVDYASFRPIEEKGRDVKFNARNDLIHVDSFPTRPSRGDRLLRIFTNVTPERERVWVSAGSFKELAERYARDAGLPSKSNGVNRLSRRTISALARLGLPVTDRPEYDRFMLRFHDALKHNRDVQDNPSNETWSFPPDSTWMCFTDTTSHACLSGQYCLEQTFMVSRASLIDPDAAPIAILERMVGFALAEPPASRPALTPTPGPDGAANGSSSSASSSPARGTKSAS